MEESGLYNTVTVQLEHEMNQAGPEVEMTVRDNMVHCRIRGAAGDSVEDIAAATHTQFRYLWELGDDAVLAKWCDVNVVRPD